MKLIYCAAKQTGGMHGIGGKLFCRGMKLFFNHHDFLIMN